MRVNPAVLTSAFDMVEMNGKSAGELAPVDHGIHLGIW
jgi:hypothetical protein